MRLNLGGLRFPVKIQGKVFMSRTQSYGTIQPDVGYSISAVARELGCSPRKVREVFINTGEIDVAWICRGAGLIPGYLILQWMERNLSNLGDSACDAETSESDEPTKKPARRSKRSGSKAGDTTSSDGPTL